MNVLVTGAGGFSGSEIVRALLRQGHRVVAVVSNTRGRLTVEADRLGELTVVAGNLASIKLPLDLQAIVHAAARSPAPGVTVDDMVRDNVLVTRRLTEHARKAGVQTFVYLSSLSIYGRIDVPVVDPSTPVRDPDVYGITKRLGEELIAADSDSFHSLAIRLPGVIGPDSVRNWLTSVLEAARAGREVPVFSPEAPFNNAAHVSDLAEFIAGVLRREWAGFEAVTIGAAGQMPVVEAVRLVVAACGSRSLIRVEEANKRSFLVSSALACERFNYRPMEIAGMLQRFASENTSR